MKNIRKKNRQAGFTLIEMLLVIVILMVIMGLVFKQIDFIQKRNRAEQVRLDIFQTSREFIDQMTRDIHQAGFPNTKMFGSAAQDPSLDANAVGIFYISPTEIHFQGDVDGDGNVDYVAYKLFPKSATEGDGNCPCLRRSQLIKDGTLGTPYEPLNQPPNWRTQVENITFKTSNDPTDISKEVIFRAYDKLGQEVDISGGLTKSIFDQLDDGWTTNTSTGAPDPSGITKIWTVQINLDVQAPTVNVGAQGYTRPEVFLTATAQVAN
jgi:prepilin-type N-terminal cleavage/methylation domain-containing protein